MTYDPRGPYGHLSGGQPPPPRSTGWTRTLVIATAVIAVAAVAGIVAVRGGSDDDASPPRQTTTPVTAAERVTTTSVFYKEPQVDDFSLAVVVLSKECFGTAGCIVTIDIELTINTVLLDPDETYQVIYEVRGGDDGAMVNNLEVTGSSYEYDSGSVVNIPSADTVLTAVVTSVRAL